MEQTKSSLLSDCYAPLVGRGDAMCNTYLKRCGFEPLEHRPEVQIAIDLSCTVAFAPMKEATG
jgi:hypothetical protein